MVNTVQPTITSLKDMETTRKEVNKIVNNSFPMILEVDENTEIDNEKSQHVKNKVYEASRV